MRWAVGTKSRSSARAGPAANPRVVSVSPSLEDAYQYSYGTNKDHVSVQLHTLPEDFPVVDTAASLYSGETKNGALPHDAETMLPSNGHEAPKPTLTLSFPTNYHLPAQVCL